MADTFDLIIVGSGSGNAIPPSLDGRRIAMVERGVFGGTCLNVGCIPSKMLVLPADRVTSVDESRRLGVNLRVDGVDWPAIRDRVFGRIDPISDGGRVYRATGNPDVELLTGTARFTGDRSFDVDGRAISADRVLLAAGARPTVPDVPGLSDVRYHTSDTIMRLDRLPKRLAVIGGGYIAVELGHVFAAYGSRVELYNRSNRLVRQEDPEISERFTEVFGRRVRLHLGVMPERVEAEGDTIVLVVDGERRVYDEVLVATGRRPNSDLLEVEKGGVDTDATGMVVVDDTMATSAEGVWAIGDLANPMQLKHLANAEARVAFHNIAGVGTPERIDRRTVPHAIFGHPQIAGVGLTEADALARGVDVVVGRRDYGGTAYGWALEDTESFAKILINRATRQIDGAHIIGPQASTLIQPLIQAMTFRTPADQVAHEVFYIHPALTEVVENALLDGLEQLEPRA
ncbi:MAG: mycothione reductase [Acidimicrobiales bacterium]